MWSDIMSATLPLPAVRDYDADVLGSLSDTSRRSKTLLEWDMDIADAYEMEDIMEAL
tara:strand:+ start:1459 stop:1629 length:171 start_codon:yes stop_codon:yes gene_type:complete